jgi:oligosaccharide repeat unit polymerase
MTGPVDNAMPTTTLRRAARLPAGTFSAPGTKKTVITICQACVLVMLLVIQVARAEAVWFAEDTAVYWCCVATGVLFGWSVWSWWTLNRSSAAPYLAFLVVAFLFNAGQTLLEVVGLNDRGLLNGTFDDSILINTLLIVMIGLAAQHLGALAAARPTRRTGLIIASVDVGRRLRLVGWLLLGISSLPAAIVLKDTASTVVSGGYLALYDRELGTGLASTPQILATFLVPAALFLLAGSAKHRTARMTAAVTILITALIQLFLGLRSAAVMPLIAFAWVWHRAIAPLRAAMILPAAAALMFIVFPVIRESRDGAGQAKLSPTVLLETYAGMKNPALAAISEMGGSMGTVAHTLTLVPANRPYDLGTGYAYAFLTVLPNVFWDVHPTFARGTASQWLVWAVDPQTAARGGGLGFSYIAEAYLNFGYFGVPLVALLVGWFVARFAASADQTGDVARLAMVAAFFAFFLKFPRDETSSMWRPLFWYSVLPYLAVQFLGSRVAARHLAPTQIQGPPVLRIQHRR